MTVAEIFYVFGVGIITGVAIGLSLNQAAIRAKVAPFRDRMDRRFARVRALIHDSRTPFDISPPVEDDRPEIDQPEIELAAVAALVRTSGAHAAVDPDPTADLIFVGFATVVESPPQDSGAQPVLEYPLNDDEVVGADETGATAPALGRLRKAGYLGHHLAADPDAAEIFASPPKPIVPTLFEAWGAPVAALDARTGFEEATGAWRVVRPWPTIPVDAVLLPIVPAAPVAVAAHAPDDEQVTEEPAPIAATIPAQHVRGGRQRVNAGPAKKGGRR